MDMIDLERAKKEFDKYTSKYDLTNEHLKRKYHHTYRVMNLSTQIAKNLKLNEEEIKTSALIGLLHDIARFPQYTKYKTFSDAESIDHGNWGVEILKNENYIKNFVEDEKLYPIIIKAIENHNKYKIQEGLTAKEEMFAKIIRDADKIDIFYEALTMFYCKPEEIQGIEQGIITDSIMENIRAEELILKVPNQKMIDKFLVNLCFIFDLNFKCSFQIVAKEDYINKTIDRFNYINEDTKNKIEQIRDFINNYIQKKKDDK